MEENNLQNIVTLFTDLELRGDDINQSDRVLLEKCNLIIHQALDDPSIPLKTKLQLALELRKVLMKKELDILNNTGKKDDEDDNNPIEINIKIV